MHSLYKEIFMVQEQVYDLTKVSAMTNKEHTQLFDLIGWELLNEKMVEAKNLDLCDFMKQIEALINSNKCYENYRVQLKLLALRFYKYVNS